MKKDNQMNEKIPKKGHRLRGIYWVIIGSLAIIASFIYALFLPAMLKWISAWDCFENSDFFFVTPAIEEWFAFYGSFSGVFVTIILTIITIRLTIQIEENNKKNILNQNISTMVMNVPYMNCKALNVYSLSERDVLRKYIDIASQGRDYLISLEMDSAFPTYFEINLSKIRLEYRRKGVDNVVCGEKTYEIGKDNTVIYNNQNLRVYLYIPKELENIMDVLYALDLVHPTTSITSNYTAKINICFELKNALYTSDVNEKNNSLNLQMSFQIKNVGMDIVNGGKQFKVINMCMSCI